MTRLALIAALVSSIALADSLGPVPSTGQGCVNGICDAGLYVVGGGPSVGTDTSGDLVLSGATLPSYVIPETGTVHTHVNATDLHNGTAKVGGAWTQNGTVPFNTGPLPSVGPFTDSNYFSQAASPAGVAGGPFTIVMLVNVASIATLPVVLSSSSFYAQISAAALAFDNNGLFAISGTTPANPMVVLFLGADSSGNIYSQVNNGSVGTSSFTAPGSPGTTVDIGRYLPSSGYGFTGTLVEIMVSNSVASHAAFNSIYSTIASEIAPTVTTQYPDFVPSENVGNFLYVDGGFQVGGTNGTGAIFMGSGPFDSAYTGIWIGQNAQTATQTNFTFLGNGSNYTLLNGPGGQIGMSIGNAQILTCDSSLCAFTNSYSASGAGQLSMWVGPTTPATIAADGIAAALSVDSSLNVNLNLGTGNALQIANDGGVVTASINASGAGTLSGVDAGNVVYAKQGNFTTGVNVYNGTQDTLLATGLTMQTTDAGQTLIGNCQPTAPNCTDNEFVSQQTRTAGTLLGVQNGNNQQLTVDSSGDLFADGGIIAGRGLNTLDGGIFVASPCTNIGGCAGLSINAQNQTAGSAITYNLGGVNKYGVDYLGDVSTVGSSQNGTDGGGLYYSVVESGLDGGQITAPAVTEVGSITFSAVGSVSTTFRRRFSAVPYCTCSFAYGTPVVLACAPIINAINVTFGASASGTVTYRCDGY